VPDEYPKPKQQLKAPACRAAFSGRVLNGRISLLGTDTGKKRTIVGRQGFAESEVSGDSACKLLIWWWVHKDSNLGPAD
jgi:hypothetical protein